MAKPLESSVLKICEIVRFQSMAPVSEMPSCVRGIVDLHGKWVPVVDLRVQTAANTEASGCIVIAECAFVSKETVEVGLIVDALDQISHMEVQENNSRSHADSETAESAADKLNDAICAWSKKAKCAALGDLY